MSIIICDQQCFMPSIILYVNAPIENTPYRYFRWAASSQLLHNTHNLNFRRQDNHPIRSSFIPLYHLYHCKLGADCMYAASILAKLASLNFFSFKKYISPLCQQYDTILMSLIKTGKDYYLCRLYILAGDAAFS